MGRLHKPVSLLAHIVQEESGSGVRVDAEHILTCAHCVCHPDDEEDEDEDEDEKTGPAAAGATASSSEKLPPPRLGRHKFFLLGSGDWCAAECVRVNEEDDLALMRILTPVPPASVYPRPYSLASAEAPAAAGSGAAATTAAATTAAATTAAAAATTTAAAAAAAAEKEEPTAGDNIRKVSNKRGRGEASSTAATTASSSAAEVSSNIDVICVGNPSEFDLESDKADATIIFTPPIFFTSEGRIRGPTRQDRLDKLGLGALHHTAWTYWGHSGAPLIDRHGCIAGLHNSWDASKGTRHGIPGVRVAVFLAAASVGKAFGQQPSLSDGEKKGKDGVAAHAETKSERAKGCE